MQKLIIFLCLFFFVACGENEQRVQYKLHGETMGTYYSITMLVSNTFSEAFAHKLQSEIDQRLNEINDSMSTYVKTSELNRFNAHPLDTQFALSPDISRVIGASLELYQVTGGAFDITVSPLVDLWGFGANSKSENLNSIPASNLVKAVTEKTGSSHLRLKDNLLSKGEAVTLDLSAIAKGYAVDEVATLLRKNGVNNYLVEIGGEITTKGVNARGQLWVLGIESPDNSGRNVYTKVSVGEGALATSGDYRNFFENEGKRYSHTIDPRTGWPVEHKLTSVSVIASNCMIADALATSLMVMGEKEGFEFAQKHSIGAYFIYHADDGLVTKHTEAFKPYLM